MTREDFPAFSIELGRTATALLYKLDAAAIGEYYEILKPYSLPRVRVGLEAARRWSDYMPRPSQVLGYMGVGVEAEPEAEWVSRPALTAGEVEQLTPEMIHASLSELRDKCGWNQGIQAAREDQAQVRERDEFWERVAALKALRGR
jgi:hypothetical protein